MINLPRRTAIEEVILRHYKEATGKNVGSSEIRSWQGSLTYMAKIMQLFCIL